MIFLNGLEITIVLLIAVAVDLALGEPPDPFHPVAWIGKVIAFLFRSNNTRPLIQFLQGVLLTLVTIGLFTIPVYFGLFSVKPLNYIAYFILSVLLFKITFSLKGFRKAARDIKQLLESKELDKARFHLRSLCGRNARDLPEPLIVSATVESVAENTCDSLVAPLFYFLFFGVQGAITYRVVNTLDAMIGHHGKYEYIGKFAARLDDVLNFIPARITAMLLVIASFLARKNTALAWQVGLSEHAKTESPNAGWSMATMAGALNVQLEKVGYYKLGKTNSSPTPETIGDSLRLMHWAAGVWIFICCLIGVSYFVFIT